MSMVLTVHPEGFAAAELKLMGVSKGAPKAISEAINRGLTAGQTFAVKRIRERYNATAAGLKSGFRMKKASWEAMGGELAARGPMLKVDVFSPSVRGGRMSKRKGYIAQSVSVMIIRGNRRVLNPDARGRGGFMTPRGVKERRQDSRYPIYPVMTIGIPYMFGKLEIFEGTQKRIDEITDKRLEHNINRLLGGGGSWSGGGKE